MKQSSKSVGLECFRLPRRKVLAGLLVAVSLAASCGGESASSPSSVGGQDTRSTVPPAIVDVVLADYAFRGLPPVVSVGTRVRARNESPTEAHELIALRIPDAERRPAEQLATLSDSELLAVLGRAIPDVVLYAGPGEQVTAEGDLGTFDEPGRYLVICQVPVGAAPEEIESSDRVTSGRFPAEYDGVPRHSERGMFAELRVD